MKADELMMGDWVSYIPEIKEGEDSYLGEPRNAQVDLPCLNLIDELIFEPIPLTAEILEKNGFDGHFLWLQEGETNGDTEYVEMELTQEGSMFFFIRRTWNNGQFKGVLKYVHELQHALRLCGLAELADNFKIE